MELDVFLIILLGVNILHLRFIILKVSIMFGMQYKAWQMFFMDESETEEDENCYYSTEADEKCFTS